MRWSDIAERVSADRVFLANNPEVSGVHYDSRKAGHGDIFVAMLGGTVDGNKFVDNALQQGCAAVITDSADAFAGLSARGIAVAQVQHGRRALSAAASAVFGAPETQLAVSAITGTNGKTTTAFLLEQLLTMAGRKCILLGTVETRIAGRVLPSEHTTPEASDLLRIFAEGVQAGCTEVVMEMSSHALVQERVWAVPVDVAVFTNLTQDHLDFHASMEGYFAAKQRLFQGVGSPPPRVSVVNTDDPWGLTRLAPSISCDSQRMLYGTSAANAEFVAEDVRFGDAGTSFTFVSPLGRVPISSSLIGGVNVSNLLAALCAGLARGLSLEQVASFTPHLHAAPGRFQLVPGSREAGFSVVVDYAHSEDALENLLRIARQKVAANGGRVITLFGCGGDRDRTKRPKMGRAAAKGSELVVITSDNPRTESPAEIIREILAGLHGTRTHFLVEQDRETAIAAAIGAARPGDIVLLAGKGHEKVQIVGHEEVPFDDVAVAARILHPMRKEERA